MNIKKKLTITLSADDVKNIVADYLTKEGYSVTPENVTLSIGSEWAGFGRDEHQIYYFKECTAVMEGE